MGLKSTFIAVSAVLVFGIAGSGQAGSLETPPTPNSAAKTGFVPAAPEPGVAIPEVALTFGLRPYADNAFYAVSIENGWFKDVGITTKDYIINGNNAPAMMLNREVDIQGMYPPSLLAMMPQSDTALKIIANTDMFNGWAMLVHPDLAKEKGLRPLPELLDSGMSLKEAMAALLGPLEGVTLTTSSLFDPRPFIFASYELAGLDRPKLLVMDDSQALTAAFAGRINFATPTGAPFTLSFEQEAGWMPIVRPLDIARVLKPGDLEKEELVVQAVGTGAHEDFINENPNTVLRVVSAIFRTMDEFQGNPEKYYSQYAPLINKYAGTNLNWNQLEQLFTDIHGWINYEDQAALCNDPGVGTHYTVFTSSAIRSLEAADILPENEYIPDDLQWSCQIYETLHWYKGRADKAIEAAGDNNADLLTQAKQHYEWRNYLDAYRLAIAAAN